MLGAAACSAFDPAASPTQQKADAASGCGLGSNGYATAYGAPSGRAATNAFCTVDGGTLGGPCDRCEATSCCALRVACYGDTTCSCADVSLDGCLGSGGAACWNAFATSGLIAGGRFDCLRAACSSACGIAAN
jgi:hypothetical protein